MMHIIPLEPLQCLLVTLYGLAFVTVSLTTHQRPQQLASNLQQARE